MYELQSNPGGGAAGEGDKDVVGGRDHGVGGDGLSELGEEIGPKAVAAEPVAIAGAGAGGHGAVGLALEAEAMEITVGNRFGVLRFEFVLFVSVAVGLAGRSTARHC